MCSSKATERGWGRECAGWEGPHVLSCCGNSRQLGETETPGWFVLWGWREVRKMKLERGTETMKDLKWH